MRLAYLFKAYSPDQPRVPAGNPDGGQWTSGGGDGSSTDPFADFVPEGIEDQYAQSNLPAPMNDGPPPKGPKWTVVARVAAGGLARAIQDGSAAQFISTLTENATWTVAKINEIYAVLDNPKSLEELNSLVDSPASGYQIHHIVEQGPASKEGYTRAEIETPTNLVRVPTLTHYDVTAYYARKQGELGDRSPREYLNGKAWYVRREFGLDTLRKFGVLK
ncbi:MAG: hypothetical protein JWM36_566 [Hyphomicrobiales bacterium]|nr:hypothetical protein [Hyphomicrobiales bacterium]